MPTVRTPTNGPSIMVANMRKLLGSPSPAELAAPAARRREPGTGSGAAAMVSNMRRLIGDVVSRNG